MSNNKNEHLPIYGIGAIYVGIIFIITVSIVCLGVK